jgi:hypothetical protein
MKLTTSVRLPLYCVSGSGVLGIVLAVLQRFRVLPHSSWWFFGALLLALVFEVLNILGCLDERGAGGTVNRYAAHDRSAMLFRMLLAYCASYGSLSLLGVS